MNVEVNQLCAGFGSVTVVRDLFFFFLRDDGARATVVQGGVEGDWGVGGGGEGGVQRELSNDARSKFLQGTSASFSFFITRESKNRNGVGS